MGSEREHRDPIERNIDRSPQGDKPDRTKERDKPGENEKGGQEGAGERARPSGRDRGADRDRAREREKAREKSSEKNRSGERGAKAKDKESASRSNRDSKATDSRRSSAKEASGRQPAKDTQAGKQQKGETNRRSAEKAKSSDSRSATPEGRARAKDQKTLDDFAEKVKREGVNPKNVEALKRDLGAAGDLKVNVGENIDHRTKNAVERVQVEYSSKDGKKHEYVRESVTIGGHTETRSSIDGIDRSGRKRDNDLRVVGSGEFARPRPHDPQPPKSQQPRQEKRSPSQPEERAAGASANQPGPAKDPTRRAQDPRTDHHQPESPKRPSSDRDRDWPNISPSSKPGKPNQKPTPVTAVTPPYPPGHGEKETLDLARRVIKLTQNRPWLIYPYFATQVRPGGPRDFKKGGQRQFEEVGNFDFGFFGRALGIPEGVLLRGAGVAQEFLQNPNYDPSFGHFWGGAPHGDNPEDRAKIQRGIDRYENLRRSGDRQVKELEDLRQFMDDFRRLVF